jgi:hypothetical protein
MALLMAVVAFFDMATEGGGAAGLDGAHQSKLMMRQSMVLPVGRPVFSKNVGQFQGWPKHVIESAFWGVLFWLVVALLTHRADRWFWRARPE